MSLPTLLREGFIVPPKGLSKSEKDLLKNTKSIDYITDFISDRTSISFGTKAKIPPKRPGDRVIILKSDTGSGKSTVLPPFLYEQFQERTHRNIAVTQPRVLNAIDITEGLPEHYPYLKLDENLGYQTGDFKRMPKDKGVIFMTTGILLQQMNIMEDEDFMRKYSYILIDEVHDRQLNVDMSLFLLKKFLTRHYENPNCPMLILMSATFDPKTFMDYFGCPKENYIQVVGSTFPIEPHFLKYDSPNYVKTASDIAEKLHIENLADIDDGSEFRDIIIFIAGAAPSKAILEKMHIFNSEILSKSLPEVLKYMENKPPIEKSGGEQKEQLVAKPDNYYIAPIDLSGKSFHQGGIEYQNLFSDINNIKVPIFKITDKGAVDYKTIVRWVSPTRRIIVSTPVAETGVTIETLKYCIDTGVVTAVDFNPDFGARTLLKKNVTQGMAMQRRGRVGRKSPGQWFPCYTEDTYKALPIDQFAEILTSDITNTLLSIFIKETESQVIEEIANLQDLTKQDMDAKELFMTNYLTNQSLYKLTSLKSLNVSTIDFLETPSATSLVYSVEKLHGLGFIDNKYNPTLLGLYANSMRKISMENCRMLLAGYAHGANMLDLITIVAFIETQRMNFMNTYKYKPINAYKKKLSDKEYEFYYKMIIGDEMVEYIFIWELYSEFLDELMASVKKKASKDKPYNFKLDMIEDWCSERKLNYEGLNKVVSTRDEIIESFIASGLNPYWNGMGIEKGQYSLLDMFRNNLDDSVGEIKKIKKCILDGYRFNLATWDDSAKKYILNYRNIPVAIRSNVLSRMGDDSKQTNANYIVLSNIMLRESMKNPGMYAFESTGTVSIMDGYLDVDTKFLMH